MPRGTSPVAPPGNGEVSKAAGFVPRLSCKLSDVKQRFAITDTGTAYECGEPSFADDRSLRGTPVAVLLIEDNEDDALLIVHELQRGGYAPTWQRVETAVAVRAALTNGRWDLIICDWVMPQFSAPAALALLQSYGTDVPIIIVSGEVGEEVAVSAMKAGAHDVVGKHRLSRLVPAVQRELREAQNQRERRQAEEALRTSEERLRIALSNSPVRVFSQDRDLRFTWVYNPAFGRTPEQVIGRTDADLVDAQDAAVLTAIKRRVLDTGIKARQVVCLTHNGDVRYFDLAVEPLRNAQGDIVGITGVATDITECTRAEEALRRGERLFRSLIENAQDLVSILNVDGTARYVSPSHSRILGYSWEELIGRHPFDFVHPDDLPNVAALLQWGTETPGATGVVQFRFRHRDGSWRILEGVAQNLVEDSVIAGIVVNARDITDQQRAADERTRLSAALEQAEEAVMITDAAGTVVYVNPASERLTGHTRAEICGQPADVLGMQWHRPEAYQQLVRTLASGGVWRGTEIHRRKDTSLYEVESIISPVYDSTGRLINFVGLGRDVTRERQMEAQLRQAQKLEAVGRLAGGVAHEFNNQLMVIKASLQLLLAQLSENDPRRREVERVRAGADKSAQLVRQLLTLSRRQPIEPRALDLNELVVEMEPILRLLLGGRIALHVRTPTRLPPVHADRGQIEQVVINLVANARDAIAPHGTPVAGGMVTIETAEVAPGEPSVDGLGPPTPGHYVMLGVSDNGCGIPPEVRDHIFEPFFTTKEVGKGTGLGLATVFGIVSQHHGSVTCASEIEHGSVFRAYFPATESGVTPGQSGMLTPGRSVASRARAAHVLIVADDEHIRELLARCMTEAGHRVDTAAGVNGALAVQGERPIDLLITEVMLRGQSGIVLARRLAEDHPAMSVLFISGYAPHTIDMSALPAARLLAKPFDLDVLLHTVSELLPTG